MADRTLTSPEVQRLTLEFQTVLVFYEKECRRQGLEARFPKIVESSLHDMSKRFRESGINVCPDGQEPCPDGKACVPQGRSCPDSR